MSDTSAPAKNISIQVIFVLQTLTDWLASSNWLVSYPDIWCTHPPPPEHDHTDGIHRFGLLHTNGDALKHMNASRKRVTNNILIYGPLFLLTWG